MPPRGAPSRGSGPPRGGPGGAGPARGASAGRGGPPSRGGAGRGGSAIAVPAQTQTPITTIGVRRPGAGTGGRQIQIYVNSFKTSIPDSIIRHYDALTPDTLPARMNMEIIKILQTDVAPHIFTPPAVYDGKKNMFANRKLTLGDTDSAEFNVILSPAAAPQREGKPPKVYKVKLTLVAEINPEVLQRFVQGKQSHDNHVLTALTALNVVIRMEPSLKYPSNIRSFFTPSERRHIGYGIELWRGYFQSVRPAVGRMLINVDISTGMMYKSGTLLDLCIDYLRLQPKRYDMLKLDDRTRIKLQRFLANVRITINTPTGKNRAKTIKKLTTVGAAQIKFKGADGKEISVADYFKKLTNKQLLYPTICCVETGSGAIYPMELCIVLEGQLMRKQIPPEVTKSVVEFATQRPQERLASIRRGLEVLAYGQSEYVRNFGMNVETASGPLVVQARVLQPPRLKYGQGSKQPTIQPANGQWNMADKKFFKPVVIRSFIVVSYESERRLPIQGVQELVRNLIGGAQSVGVNIQNKEPMIKFENGQGRIGDQLRQVGGAHKDRYGSLPDLIVVILPENGNDIYNAVKHFGDIAAGVPTQCLKASKCSKAKIQYWANVMLKINVKMGGVNSIPDPADVAPLTDPGNPTIVMGADVIHPAPGADGRPSFTALVSNVDSNNAKYIATSRVQTSKQEIIDDLQDMAKHCLTKYMSYRKQVEGQANPVPKRIIFYRDGVSEGQFQHVLDFELPLLKQACADLGISPKITIIVVGKRHHMRMFPHNERDADRSGNCPAGTIVDTDVAHPTEFDFYLCSHGGLLGTSRPAHYSVLHDENSFQPNALQALSFALCHVYARSTRSVSIPAPVYYADIVCTRAKTHYDPENFNLMRDEDGSPPTNPTDALEAFKQQFKKLNPRQETMMYFS